MSDQIQEVLDIPRDFVREGTQFINKCTKPDRREFIKISQAVGVGFLVMGAVGYLVKLSQSPDTWIRNNTANSALLVHIPVNNILVGGA
ncbi:protein secE/sec61-gamma protein [Diplocarpon rosae]|nr:protein secE/sec61-gamma protein [Diplocarpon rosae]